MVMNSDVLYNFQQEKTDITVYCPVTIAILKYSKANADRNGHALITASATVMKRQTYTTTTAKHTWCLFMNSLDVLS